MIARDKSYSLRKGSSSSNRAPCERIAAEDVVQPRPERRRRRRPDERADALARHRRDRHGLVRPPHRLAPASKPFALRALKPRRRKREPRRRLSPLQVRVDESLPVRRSSDVCPFPVSLPVSLLPPPAPSRPRRRAARSAPPPPRSPRPPSTVSSWRGGSGGAGTRRASPRAFSPPCDGSRRRLVLAPRPRSKRGAGFGRRSGDRRRFLEGSGGLFVVFVVPRRRAPRTGSRRARHGDAT